MADDADKAGDLIADTAASNIARLRLQAAAIREGAPGDCDFCGEHSERLIDGVCAPCRDKNARYAEIAGRKT